MSEAPAVTTVPAIAPAPDAAPVVPPVAAPPAEAPKEVPVEQDPRFASKFAALSKREQQIRERDSAIKAREAEFKTWQEQQKLAEDDPLKYMESRGWTFDKLTKLALNDGKKPPEMRIEELEAKLAAKEKAKEEEAAANAQRDLDEKRTAFLQNAKTFLEQNKDKYELTANEEEGPELIHNVMWANFEKSGTRLTFDQAAEMVEKHFDDAIDNKYSKIKKIQDRFKPKEPAPVAPATTAPAARATSSTLTNSQAASVPTPADSKALSVEESKAAAARLLRWT